MLPPGGCNLQLIYPNMIDPMRTFKNANNCSNTNIYSYLETSGGQSFNIYLNVVHFFNTSLNKTSVTA
jgi:hypothetical protein